MIWTPLHDIQLTWRILLRNWPPTSTDPSRGRRQSPHSLSRPPQSLEVQPIPEATAEGTKLVWHTLSPIRYKNSCLKIVWTSFRLRTPDEILIYVAISWLSPCGLVAKHLPTTSKSSIRYHGDPNLSLPKGSNILSFDVLFCLPI